MKSLSAESSSIVQTQKISIIKFSLDVYLVNELKRKLFKFLFFSFQTEQFTVLWILFAVIVLGNTAVLVTLFVNKSRKSRMNFFIKHLAIAGNVKEPRTFPCILHYP